MVATGHAIETFGKVMARGGAGLIISSQTGYMYPIPYEIEQEILNTDTDRLSDLKFIKETAYQNSGLAYMIAKRVNHLQVMKAAAGSWKKAGARINSISPGIIVTPLAYDEFNGPGTTYQNMIDNSAVMRTGSIDEIAEAGAFLLGEHAKFITGSDLLIDGGSGAAKADQIESICAQIAAELRAQGLSDCEDVYLEPHAFAVQSGIIDRELRALHIMEG